MASKELIESWKRTERFLLDARAQLANHVQALCVEELNEFDDYIDHNELELALDMLDAALEKSAEKSSQVLELMALAAESMGLSDRQKGYDARRTTAPG